MLCPFCRAEVTEGQSFCSGCGSAILSDAKPGTSAGTVILLLAVGLILLTGFATGGYFLYRTFSQTVSTQKDSPSHQTPPEPQPREVKEEAAPQDQQNKAQQSMEYIRTIATAVEAYAVDHVGYPAGNLEGIRRQLEPGYIPQLPLKDAWDRPFRYEVSADHQGYRIVSAGSDGVFRRETWHTKVGFTDPREDLLFETGEFVRYWSPTPVPPQPHQSSFLETTGPSRGDIVPPPIQRRSSQPPPAEPEPVPDFPQPDEPGFDRDEPLRMRDGMTMPELIQKVNPDYPPAARRARIQGVVILEAIILKDGTVEDVRVLRGVHPLLNESALRAVRQWRYNPATFHGRPIKVFFTITVRFKLQ